MDKCVDGYQYQILVRMLGQAMPALLDSGSSITAITEEAVVGLISSARVLGVKASDPENPSPTGEMAEAGVRLRDLQGP